jgi:lysozyme
MHARLAVLLAVGVTSVGCAVPTEDQEADFDAQWTRRCAAGTTVAGIDVSYYQPNVDWAKVRGGGYRFAFLRVSDGLRFPDDKFASHWAGAKGAGILRGAYQFFRPAQDAAAQANLLLQKMGTLGPDDLPPVIDVEVQDGVSDAVLVSKVQTWLDIVEKATGRTPIIYAASGFWETIEGRSRFSRYPLWVANYGVSCPATPDTWSKWHFWQQSDTGRVPGISGGVDVNVWNGTYDQLLAFARGSAAQAPQTVPAFAIDWQRGSDGNYTFTAAPSTKVSRVVYTVDGFEIGRVERTASATFTRTTGFTTVATGRIFRADGYDATGKVVEIGNGVIDTTAAPAVFVKQKGGKTYEIGLENVPAGVASIEVRADDWLLPDAASSGATRSTRKAVLYTFNSIGTRKIAISTFNADGSPRGTIQRTVTLR